MHIEKYYIFDTLKKFYYYNDMLTTSEHEKYFHEEVPRA